MVLQYSRELLQHAIASSVNHHVISEASRVEINPRDIVADKPTIIVSLQLFFKCRPKVLEHTWEEHVGGSRLELNWLSLISEIAACAMRNTNPFRRGNTEQAVDVGLHRSHVVFQLLPQHVTGGLFFVVERLKTYIGCYQKQENIRLEHLPNFFPKYARITFA
jgi:hypothetical protein